MLPPESYGAALQYFTGSKEHNVKLRTICVKEGYKLNEYGLFNRETDELVAAESEEEIYRKLGMAWIPPELRENTGEIEVAMQDSLPDLVEADQIRGDLHVHSDWSDGKATIQEMTEKALEMGHEYIAITDHTKTLAIAKGLNEERLLKQIREIDRIDEEYPDIRVLRGTECDILSNGSLDIRDDVLKDLDWVVASIHSGFRMDEDKMTRRILDAIHNDHVNLIGHPTGRLIQRRSPYAVNLDAVFNAASEQNVSLEINCFPDRLDLSDVNCHRAREKGVKMTLGSDAHATSEMEFIAMGVSVARRGWLEPKNVLNTLGVKKLLS